MDGLFCVKMARSSNGKACDLNENNSSFYVKEEESNNNKFLNIEYDMTRNKYLVVFNHFSYKKTVYFGNKVLRQRNGTDKDVKRLNEVFGKYEFKVNVFNDLKHEEIIDEVLRITSQDHSKTSCFAVAVLTHGGSNGELAAADRYYNVQDILRPFHSAQCSLVGKPKLFFVQACNGKLTDEGRRIAYDGFSKNAFLWPTHADYLILYSSVEGYVSWRDSRGSWMIQELCTALDEYGKHFDILQIITLMNKEIARQRISYNPDPDFNNKKIIPDTQFTLTRLLRF